MTYMNRSGQAVGPLANFFKISPEEILVVHDELDIPPGTAKLKKGGGHGGHNGLKDIIRCLANSKEFHRLRLGIGHPGDSKQVANYVLKKAPANEMQAIEATIDEAARVLPTFLAGDTAKAMNQLHSFKG
jgi:PTH1 family peptidyl-tRNA hydrolase